MAGPRWGRPGESLGERDGGAVAIAVRVVVVARLVAVTREAQIIHREDHGTHGIADIAAVDGALALAAGEAGTAAGDATAPGAADHGIGEQAGGGVMDEDGYLDDTYKVFDYDSGTAGNERIVFAGNPQTV